VPAARPLPLLSLLLGACATLPPATAGYRTCGAATLIAPDTVSTPVTEVRLALSADARRMLWGVIGREGGAGGWDVWERVRGEDGAWSAPRAPSFNSAENDFDPALSPDGRTVYFFSNRAGGQGGDDLYEATLTASGEWGPARNLGPAVNTAKSEWAPVVSADGRTLMFASDGRGGVGKQDLWWAERTGEGWGRVRPAPGVNSAEDDFDAAFLPGGGIVFARGDAEAGRMTLYLSDRAGVRQLGAEVNPAEVPTFGPSVSAAERGMLLFSSHHVGNVRGRIDLYRIPLCAD
jgi:hypothetical protein